MVDTSKDMNDLLTEEMEEEAIFKSLTAHKNTLSEGIVHSLTSDTLDSVYLDPPAIEQDIEGPEESGLTEPHLDRIVEKVDSEYTVQDKESDRTEENIVRVDSKADFLIGDTKDVIDEAENVIGETKEVTAKDLSQPSLSKYFGTADDDDPFAQDFFSSLPPVNDEQKMEQNNLGKAVEVPESHADQFMERGEMADEMFNLTINDSLGEKSNSHRSHQEPQIENVDFDLEVGEQDKVETPEDIEGKDDFESFTADVADTETMDALGMSPAATSFMTDRNLQNFFRQTSQPDNRSPLCVSRQISHTSAPENITPVAEVIEGFEESDETSVHKVLETSRFHHVMHQHIASHENTPVHHPIFPPSVTLSPGESPVHQPSYATQESSPATLTSPEHKVSAFQAFQDSSVNDDPFSASIQMSDSDRQHDAWIPSEATKTILISKATHATSTYEMDSEMFVAPILVITEPQGDPVRDLVYRYMGEQEALKRQVLSADRVTQDADGIKELMEAGCYRSALDLTGRLLTQHGQNQAIEQPIVHSTESLQLWFTRFSMMMKMRMYSIVESELVAFKNLDSPDMYYEFYPHTYPGKRGSIVPFGMRLLHAELPHHLGRSQETLDRLYYILAITQKILKNLHDGLAEDGSAVTISADSRKVSEGLWKNREIQTLNCIGNTLVAVRDYDAALSVYDTLLEKDPSHRLALLSGLGRIHLQIGNLPKAMEYFKQVRQSSDTSDGGASISLLMCCGFEAMCQNNFSEAYQNFKSAVQVDPTNPSAVNNMAVCCLYLGRLKEALKSLEALVHSNPSKNLHEGILFNLCTLYELESSRALHKKQALLDLVSKHKGDGFPVVCLKMT